MNKINLLVIGDSMIDHNIILGDKKLSAETDIDYYKIFENSFQLGGAANLIQSLSSYFNKKNITFLTSAANDEVGKILKDKLNKICNPILFTYRSSITTTKKRFYYNGNQIFRVDNEEIIKNYFDKSIISFLKKNIINYNYVIVSDYNKGFVNNKILKCLSNLKKKYQFVIIADSKKQKLSLFKNFDFLKQNLKEFKNLNIKKNKLKEQINKNHIKNYILSKSGDGLEIINKKKTIKISNKNNILVKNVSGAGDTMISALTIFLSLNYELSYLAKLVNTICTIKVTEEKTCYLTKKFLKNFIFLLSNKFNLKQIQNFFVNKKKIGFTNGCFDILHKGHYYSFNRSLKICDLLVVGLNSDNSIKLLKGKNRPYNKFSLRKENINEISKKIIVMKFNAKTPINLIKNIYPDFIIKGQDYLNKKVVGAQLVKNYGGKLILLKYIKGYSTTKILKQIKYE